MVIRKILYPTDFSEPARHAGRYATMLARTLDASLRILHVPYAPFPPASEPQTGPSFDEFRKAAREESQAALQRLLEEEEFRGLDVSTTLATGLIEDEILNAAQTSDLVVMGTHGRSGLSRFMLGSVTEKVIGVAPCAVLAVTHPPLERELPWAGGARRRAHARRPPRLLNILIPLDGSTLSESVLRDTKALARSFGAVVTLLMVMSPSLMLDEDARIAGKDNPREGTEQYLRAMQRDLETEGLMVEVVHRTGDAAMKILEYADERDTDLIALATHGRSGLRRWLLGSVANKLLRAADVPVLVSRAWSPSRQRVSATAAQPARTDSTGQR
jgi:nucleotide-binding universal stress UspA family protein